jgi:hypothetical protein
MFIDLSLQKVLSAPAGRHMQRSYVAPAELASFFLARAINVPRLRRLRDAQLTKSARVSRFEITARCARSIEREIELKDGAHAHRFSVSHCRLEADLLCRFDRAFRQSVGQSFDGTNVVNLPVCAEENAQDDSSLQ